MNNVDNNKNKKRNVPDLTDKGTEILNVPKLRFKEFEGEWEEKRLADVCSFFSGGTPSSSNKDYYGGNIPFIRSGELHKEETELFITQSGYDNSSAKMVEVGDLLLAMYGATSGDIAISKINGAINQAILCIRTVQNKKFIESVWNKHVSKILKKYLQGGQGNLSADIVKNISISFPNLKEQDKLSKLLFLLDERISSQNELIDRLQSLIKGINQHLLSIRDDWRTVKLKDILKIGNGKDYKSLTKGDVPVFGTGGYMLSVNESLYDGESVCIGRKGTINKPMFLKGRFWTVDTLFYTYDFKDVLPKFCYYLFERINWLKYNEGTGVPSLSKATIENIKVKVPSMQVQTAICDVLDGFEKKINNEYTYLESLNKQKQYLLRQMFI